MIPGEQIYVNYISTGDGQDPTSTDGTGFEIGSTPQPIITAAQNEQVNEIVANRGRIGGWIIQNGVLKGGNFIIHSDGYIDINNGDLYIDGDNKLIRLGQSSGYHINLDGTNGRIRSSDYQTGVSGFNVDSNLIEAQNLRARGVLQSAVFQKDIISAIGGVLLVANADVLDADMTAADNSTLTIKGDTTFAANDVIRLKNATDDEWLRVTNAASAPTYTVTRDLAGSYSANNNPAWTKGQAVVKQGESNGTDTYSGGWLQLFGEGTNSPYYSVFSRTGVAYNSYAERVRLGNLNGIGDFAAETYGIFIGSTTDASKRLTYDDVSGDLVVNGSKLNFTPFYGDGSDGDLTTSGDVTLTSDMYYDDLTVSTGDTLFTAGYRVFVRGTCTVTGTISRAGNAGGNGGNSTLDSQGTAGSAGSALAAGNLAGTDAGLAGKIGAAGQASGTGNNGTAGAAGSALTNLVVNSSNAGTAGGSGASAAGNSGGAAGAAGAAGGVTASVNKPKHVITAIQMFDSDNTTSLKPIGHNGGSGSGGSGGSAGTMSGGGGGSGGNGSNGGVMVLCAKILAGGGTITCAGGNGGTGGNGGNGTNGSFAAGGGGGGGGGNGGNGGVMVLIYNQKTFSGTLSVAGGTGGTGGTGGVGGSGGGGTGGTGGTGTSTAGLKVELEV